MVEKVERFRNKVQVDPFVELKKACHAEVDHFLARPAKSVERLVRNDRKIERRGVKHRCEGTGYFNQFDQRSERGLSQLD